MRRIGCFLSAAICVLSFSLIVAAQDIPNYLFIEAVDSNRNPIKDAKVFLINAELEAARSRQEIERGIQTDERGAAYFSLLHIGNDFSDSLFKIAKAGYFDFFDFGVPMRPRGQASVTVELLKIPATGGERKALGDEQTKREFLWAAKNGAAATVAKMLKKGISANLSTNDLRGVSEPKNVPAILFAAASGDGETIGVLLKAGAKVRAKEEPLRSVLGYYLIANPIFRRKFQTEIEKSKLTREYQKGIDSLLKAGADTNDLIQKGQNALMLAAEMSDADSVSYLVKRGFSVNARDEIGRTALMRAMSPSQPEKSESPRIKVVEILLKAGADPNVSFDHFNWCDSALMRAVSLDNLEIIKLLIAYKADVNFTCRDGTNALRLAKRNQPSSIPYFLEIIKTLEAAGAK
jgi:ankyrin repeat protein